MKKPIRLPANGAGITLNGGGRVVLDKSPNENDTVTDTDGDGLPDSAELIFPSGTMDLKAYITHRFMSDTKYSEIIETLTVPISIPTYNFKSNPALADSDDNGLADSGGSKNRYYSLGITAKDPKPLAFYELKPMGSVQNLS